jgi:DNA-binding MarR family transcriptional regulator
MLSDDWIGTSPRQISHFREEAGSSDFLIKSVPVLAMAAEAEAEMVGDRPSLRDLASDLADIAARISTIADRADLPLVRDGFTPARIRTLLEARYKRSAAFRLELIHPGWSILLVLFCAHLEGTPVRMARLATDAHVAMTTMMRWTALFLVHGLAERHPDPAHARGVLLALSTDGAALVRGQLIAEIILLDTNWISTFTPAD